MHLAFSVVENTHVLLLAAERALRRACSSGDMVDVDVVPWGTSVGDADVLGWLCAKHAVEISGGHAG